MANRERFSSTTVFIYSAIGMAVGLGNIWRFPYVLGTSGGSGFLLIYLACILLLSLPLLIMEFVLGRRGQANPVDCLINVARESNVSEKWQVIGIIGVVVNILVLSFYFVVTGWVLARILHIINGSIPAGSMQDVQDNFHHFLANPVELVLWQTLAIIVVVFVLSKGIKGGLEKAMNIMIPSLFIVLILLVIFSSAIGDFSRTLNFLFSVDLNAIDQDVVVMAIGQAFFTVGVGASAGIVFGGYLEPSGVSMVKSGLIIVAADTFVALLAGFAVFPIIFQQGINPAAGPELIFIALPLAFANIPLGGFVHILFMGMLSLAALTSAIVIFEIPLLWLIETFRIKRTKAAIILATVIWVAGLGTVFSFNYLSDFYPLEFIAKFSGKTIFDIVEYISIHLLIPINAILVAVFCGYFLNKKIILEELALKESGITSLLYKHLRYVIPVILITILFHGF